MHFFPFYFHKWNIVKSSYMKEYMLHLYINFTMLQMCFLNYSLSHSIQKLQQPTLTDTHTHAYAHTHDHTRQCIHLFIYKHTHINTFLCMYSHTYLHEDIRSWSCSHFSCKRISDKTLIQAWFCIHLHNLSISREHTKLTEKKQNKQTNEQTQQENKNKIMIVIFSIISILFMLLKKAHALIWLSIR